MTTNISNQQTVEHLIESLKALQLKDISVSYTLNWESNNRSGGATSKIVVHWDKFYDSVCGNGWMYAEDAHFVFKSDNLAIRGSYDLPNLRDTWGEAKSLVVSILTFIAQKVNDNPSLKIYVSKSAFEKDIELAKGVINECANLGNIHATYGIDSTGTYIIEHS